MAGYATINNSRKLVVATTLRWLKVCNSNCWQVVRTTKICPVLLCARISSAKWWYKHICWSIIMWLAIRRIRCKMEQSGPSPPGHCYCVKTGGGEGRTQGVNKLSLQLCETSQRMQAETAKRVDGSESRSMIWRSHKMLACFSWLDLQRACLLSFVLQMLWMKVWSKSDLPGNPNTNTEHWRVLQRKIILDNEKRTSISKLTSVSKEERIVCCVWITLNWCVIPQGHSYSFDWPANKWPARPRQTLLDSWQLSKACWRRKWLWETEYNEHILLTVSIHQPSADDSTLAFSHFGQAAVWPATTTSSFFCIPETLVV